MCQPVYIYPTSVFPPSSNLSTPFSQTIGAAFGAKKVSIAGESVTLGIWVCHPLCVCCGGVQLVHYLG